MIIDCQDWLFSILQVDDLLFNFSDDDMFKIIKCLNINKVHGHDNISVRMIKICEKAIVKSLSVIYKNYINTGIFLDLWDKSNIVSVHKKSDKQLLQNYTPVSLLPIPVKTFENILFSSIFEYLQENNLLYENQSGF